jgi:hypothetical protein
MGMFDLYQPRERIRCPECSTDLVEWQGKDGPCGLFLWKEGHPAPISQDVDEEIRLTDAMREQLRLPRAFTIYSYDCPRHQPIDASCEAPDGVWVSTKVHPSSRRTH